jgi:hypothetical protein
MLSVCFVAFAVSGSPTPVVYALPGCDPKNTGKMFCEVEAPSPLAQHWAICYADNKVVHHGRAYRVTET